MLVTANPTLLMVSVVPDKGLARLETAMPLYSMTTTKIFQKICFCVMQLKYKRKHMRDPVHTASGCWYYMNNTLHAHLECYLAKPETTCNISDEMSIYCRSIYKCYCKIMRPRAPWHDCYKK